MTTGRTRSDLQLYSLGNYKIQGITLGRGNFAKVVLATHNVVGAAVALKIIDTSADVEDYVIRNLEREAKILSLLNHPNIVKLYEASMCSSMYCLSLECVLGGDLGEHVRKQKDKRLKERDAKILFHQLISAISHMHGKRILHRDLKLENILMVNSHILKLADFGLSNFYCPRKPLRTRCGSPEYAAPELFTSDVTYGPAVDMWSAGVILYVMVVGAVPFVYPKKSVATVEARRKLLHEKCSKGLVDEHFKAMKHVSKGCQDLIYGLLDPDQVHRTKLKVAENHAWLATDPAFVLPGAQVDPAVYKELHPIVLNRLSALTLIPEKELEEKVGSSKFNKFYAMYHLMRDSMLKSGTPVRTSFHNAPSKESDPCQQPKHQFQNLKRVVPLPAIAESFKSNVVKAETTCNRKNMGTPVSKNIHTIPCRLPVRTPSKPVMNSNLEKVNKMTEKLVYVPSEIKNEKGVAFKLRQPGEMSRALPPCNRNVLLSSICERQKDETKTPDLKTPSKLNEDVQTGVVLHSGDFSKVISPSKDLPPLNKRTNNLGESYTSPQQVERSTTFPTSANKSFVMQSSGSKIAGKYKVNNIMPTSSTSKDVKELEKSAISTTSKELYQTIDKKISPPLKAKVGNTCLSQKVTPAKSVAVNAPITILKRPITISKTSKVTSSTPISMPTAKNTFTPLKKPIFKKCLKAQSTVVPTAQMKTDTTLEVDASCNMHEVSSSPLGKPVRNSQTKNPMLRNHKTVEFDETYNCSSSGCGNNTNKEECTNDRTLVSNQTDSNKKSTCDSRLRRSFSQALFACDNDGSLCCPEKPNSLDDSEISQLPPNVTVTRDLNRTRVIYTSTNRPTLYHSTIYRSPCTEPSHNHNALAPGARHPTRTVYSAVYNRSGPQKETLSNCYGNPVRHKDVRQSMNATRTSHSIQLEQNCRRNQDVPSDRVAEERNKSGDSSIHVKCYSCETNFASDGRRRVTKNQSNHPSSRNVFGGWCFR